VKTASLPIQKSTAKTVDVVQKLTGKNCVVVDSEIGSQTMSVPIQKLISKNCVAAD
jgi:hypothetical protein